LQSKITVYGANWCSDCRRTKKYLGEQRIHYDWRDIEEESPEGRAAFEFVLVANEKVHGKAKRKIPVLEIVENGQKSLVIEPSNAELAEKLGLASEASKEFYHVVIVGAGPAGMTAAIYLARDGYDVLVIERSTIGGQSYITNRLDNYPGFPEGITGDNFSQNLRKQAERFGVEILTPYQVKSIVPCHKTGSFEECSYKIVRTKDDKEFLCNAVVIATGTTYRQLVVPGIESLIGINVHYCATCDGFFYKGKHLFVVGGGNSAFEEGLFLKNKFADHVTLLVRKDEPSASPALQEKVADTEGIDVWLNCEIIEVKGEDKLEKVLVRHGDNEEIIEYAPDGIFVFIGLTPNTRFLEGIVELDSQKFIQTDHELKTSARGIFAAGDCRKGSSKQTIAAAGEGATAALMAREYLRKT
jgi:thioredoxin reductase (NADPH)